MSSEYSPMFCPAGSTIKANEHPKFLRQKKNKEQTEKFETTQKRSSYQEVRGCDRQRVNISKASLPVKEHFWTYDESDGDSPQKDTNNTSVESSEGSSDSSGSSTMSRLEKIRQRNQAKKKIELQSDSSLSSHDSSNKNENKTLLVDEDFQRNLRVFSIFDTLLIQGPMSIPLPFKDVKTSYLHKTLKKTLLEFPNMTKLQSYAWPTILRGLNVCTIVKKENLIFSFLPPLVQLNLQKIDEISNDSELLTIILCSNVDSCKTFYNSIKKLQGNDNLNVFLMNTEIKQRLRDCNILITTPSLLVKALDEHFIDIRSLFYFAIDGANVVLKDESDKMVKILKLLNETIMKRNNNRLQVILNSEKWTLDIKILLKHLRVPSFVLIENYLEAIWYGDVKFQRKSLKLEYKKFALEDALRPHYLTHKTVVFCDESDLNSITEHLRYKGIELLEISQYTDDQKISDYQELWLAAKPEANVVLICTDGAFEKLTNIVNASFVIFYSLPDSWGEFIQRGRCLMENIPYFLTKSDEKNKILLFLEENYDDELLYIYHQGVKRNNTYHLKF